MKMRTPKIWNKNMSKMKKKTMPKECKNDKEDSVENEKESVEKKKIKKRK